MQIGISSFGEVAPAHVTGQDYAAAQRTQELLAMGKLADEVGFDVLALGEHHRFDVIISVPKVVRVAVAAITKRIRLSSVVTVFSSVDPVCTFQNFATVDLISNNRVEIIAALFAAHKSHWSRARLVAHGPTRHFDYLCGPQGPLLVGSPQDIIAELLYQYQLFNNTRFLAQLIIEVGLPHQILYICPQCL